ncbi:hypothetical protein JC221_104 [Yersinia phage JC221]|nr:hypothetical protein JC221_104 [Yersinia phage JC221]
MSKPVPEKKVYAKGRFNTVYIQENRDGSVTLTDDFGDDTVWLDAAYLKRLGKDAPDAIRYSAAEFYEMAYLYPVEDFDSDGLYGA